MGISEKDIWQRMTGVFRQVLRQPDLIVEAGTTAWNVPGWDSIAHLQILLALEKEFSIQLEIHEVAGIDSAGELAAWIARKHKSE